MKSELPLSKNQECYLSMIDLETEENTIEFLEMVGDEIVRGSYSGYTNLFWALHMRQIKVAKALVRLGSPINEQDMYKANELGNNLENELKLIREEYLSRHSYIPANQGISERVGNNEISASSQSFVEIVKENNARTILSSETQQQHTKSKIVSCFANKIDKEREEKSRRTDEGPSFG